MTGEVDGKACGVARREDGPPRGSDHHVPTKPDAPAIATYTKALRC